MATSTEPCFDSVAAYPSERVTTVRTRYGRAYHARSRGQGVRNVFATCAEPRSAHDTAGTTPRSKLCGTARAYAYRCAPKKTSIPPSTFYFLSIPDPLIYTSCGSAQVNNEVEGTECCADPGSAQIETVPHSRWVGGSVETTPRIVCATVVMAATVSAGAEKARCPGQGEACSRGAGVPANRGMAAGALAHPTHAQGRDGADLPDTTTHRETQ